MGNLFYNVLGGRPGDSIATTHNANYNLFTNIQSEYCSGVYFYGSLAWDFGFSQGDANHAQISGLDVDRFINCAGSEQRGVPSKRSVEKLCGHG